MVLEKENEAVAAYDDAEIIRRVKAGETTLFDELVGRYAGRFYQLSFGLIGNCEDAEEVVQDAFLRAFRGLESFRGDSAFETWMHRIVVNLSRNKYQWNRRRGSEVNVSLTRNDDGGNAGMVNEEFEVADFNLGPDQLLDGVELERRTMEELDKLPESLREVMVLRHLDEMSYEGISTVLGCKMGTVKSRLARARELLKSKLGL